MTVSELRSLFSWEEKLERVIGCVEPTNESWIVAFSEVCKRLGLGVVVQRTDGSVTVVAINGRDIVVD